MGPCFSSKHINENAIKEEFKKDRSINDMEYQPLYSTVYILMRKHKDLEIIHSRQSTPILKNSSSINIQALTPHDLKMLYNFKTIISVGKNQIQIEAIKQNSTPKIIYKLSEEHAQYFAQNYPIFDANHKNVTQTKNIPLLVFRESELVGHHESDSHLQIFVHAIDYKNDEINKKLGISKAIELSSKPRIEVKKDLIHMKNGNILILHPTSVKQNQLFHFFAEFLQQKYKILAINAKIYLRRVFPQTEIIETEADNQQIHIQTKKQRKKSIPKDEMTLQQKYAELFKKLYKDMGANKEALGKTERAYNLLVTLISNIYSHKDDENYRRVKKTNKQINELLGKYGNGVKLLTQVGFVDSEGFFVNEVQQKYLKIYRTDLDLGYRYFIEMSQ